MAQPLMPMATAVWLVENTTLTFEQIAAFCGLHELEVQAIADDEVAPGMQGLDPVAAGQLTRAELERCTADPDARLELAKSDTPQPVARPKGARYTPVAKRQQKPDAIDWLLRNHPELSDAQIGRLLGTTKPTIQAVRERTHWNSSNIRPQHPVELGFCKLAELDRAVERAQRRIEREAAKAGQAAAGGEAEPVPGPDTAAAPADLPADVDKAGAGPG